ncbi:MAG: OmpH family outer membrane protein [Melioribacteraceae bacterium]|nr:OmpH family outer membrane protein [Melioribacteraceae bacterium]MDD3557123.1 OmpH family outer membrane protein [Melioribacteraceae bacterium]
MQKLSILIVSFFLMVTGSVSAQIQIGYIDSDAIMKELPDAQDAQTRLDALIQEWNEELKKIENEWKTKYDDYENRKLIMSQQRRAEVEKELVQLENNISEYRQKKFGVNGDLFKNQEELMKPVQNKIFNAINEVAKEMDLDFVFDRSGDILFLYAKEEYDITPLVLEKLK